MKKLVVLPMVLAVAACGQANVDEAKLKEGLAKAGEAGKQLAGQAEGMFRDFLKDMKPDKEATEASLAATGETVIGETDKAAAPAAEAPQQADAGAAPPADPAAAAQAEVAAKVEELRKAAAEVIPAGNYKLRNSAHSLDFDISMSESGEVSQSGSPFAQMRKPELGSDKLCFEAHGSLSCYLTESKTDQQIVLKSVDQATAHTVTFTKKP